MLEMFGYKEWADQYISRHKRQQLAYRLAILGILVASFLAFRDIYVELQATKKELDQAKRESTPAMQRPQEDNTLLKEKYQSTHEQLGSLQAALQPRRLSDEQRTRLTDILAAHSGSQLGNITIRAHPSCHECHIYMEDLVTALKSIPGWTVSGGSNSWLNVDFVGLGIGVKDPQALPSAAHAIITGLHAANLPFTIQTLDFLSPEGFFLVVGGKP